MNLRHATIILAFILLSVAFASNSWAVYFAPIIALKHAEQAERAGDHLKATGYYEFVADFYKFVSIPQFEDDMEYFQELGEEDKVKFCQNTIAGFQKSMKLCLKKAEKNRIEGNITEEQIDKYRQRNRIRMLASCELYPVMHNQQMGVDVGVLESNGEFAEDFEKAAEGRDRTARLYDRITVPWVLHEADVLEKEGKAGLASEYREKVEGYRKKAEYNRQKAASNRQKVAILQRFADIGYVMSILENEEPALRKLALKKLARDTNYPGLLKAARSAYSDVGKMAKEALESNTRLFEAIKADALVLALGSASIDIRRTAIEELENLAGTTFGYDPNGDESIRSAGLAKWQDWLMGKLKSGLSGVYYKGKNFDKEIMARVDDEINFQWNDKPHRAMPADRFSIRWTGKISIPKAGEYTLSVKADDGARIWIGEEMRQIITVWSEYSYAAHTKKVYLEEGLHDVKIEYYENDKNATMKLFWDSADTKKKIVPEENLFHVSL
ncbi:PA14 domain-containing protein [Candidatus Poribacteria bacterium]